MKLPRRGPTHLAHSIKMQIDLSRTNLPVIQRVRCTDHERETIGPHLKGGVFRQSMGFKDSWKLAHTSLARITFGIG